MNVDFFRENISRLKKTFGDKNYEDERVTIFWRAWQHVDDIVFVSAIDWVIANCRFTPLQKEIDEAITVAEDHMRSLRVINSKRTSQEIVFGSTFTREQESFTLKAIVARAVGSLPEDEWLPVLEAIHEKHRWANLRDGLPESYALPNFNPTTTKTTRTCSYCAGKGVVFAEKKETTDTVAPYVFRCRCTSGEEYLKYPQLPSGYRVVYQ